MSVRVLLILLLVTCSLCQEDNGGQKVAVESEAVIETHSEPAMVDVELPPPVPEVKVESAQFHPKATNGEDVTPPPTEPVAAPPVEAEKVVVEEPLVIKLEEPVVVKLPEERKEEEPTLVAEPLVEVVKVVEAVKEEMEKIEKAVLDQATEPEVEAKPVEQDAEEAVVEKLEEKLVEKLVEGLVEEGVPDQGLPEEPVAGPVEEPVAEVIPSFQEFKESQIKKDSDKKENGVKEGLEPEAAKPAAVKKRKKVEKNYADTACGAKIVASNKESKNTAALLNSNRDLYVMNPCEASIWFVLELCDTVQVEALQLANFELFSSSIENFNVFTSSSYPTKQWTQVGPFVAKNNRNLQKFQLEPNGEYSKFVKFEKISHYVKEHFCVITTFQVLGTSMVEEYEGQQQPEEEEVDPYEETLDGEKKRGPESGDKSIIAGARNLANNLLDSALNLLGGSSGAADSADNTTNKTVHVLEAVVEEKVVVKVDEAGKEIKVELTQADKMRVKGETGDKPVATVVKPPAEPPAKPKPIMEAVDLKEEDVVETKPAEEVVIVKAAVEPVAPVEEEGEEVVEQAKVVVKEEEPLQDREATGDREEMKVVKPIEEKGKVESDGKGVIMSSSPKKNSIFVELDKKIKDLEYNLSLSNDYLETLSSRYKKVNNLFKPLEKTLSTFDDTMKEFEGRLEVLETSISSLNMTIQRQVDVNLDNQESYKSITTSINIILFLLTLLVIMCWRVSSKVNAMQLAMAAQRIPFAPPAPPKRIASDYQLSNIENIDPKLRGRQSFDVGAKKKKTKQKVKKDPISSAGLLFGESNNIPAPNNALKHSKSAESIPIELIYPTNDLYKRKVKFKN